jgi:hypothetical protein
MFVFEIYYKKLYQKPDAAEDPYACVLQLQLFTATVRMQSRGQREREVESNKVLQQYRHALSCVGYHFFFPLFLFLAAILMPDTCSEQCQDAVPRALQAVFLAHSSRARRQVE